MSDAAADRPVQSPMLCNIIAWASLCLVGTAFGSMVDREWQWLALQMGIFGLAAALGLSKASRYQQTAKIERERRTAAETAAKRSAEIMSTVVSSEDAPAVVDRLIGAFRDEDRAKADRRSEERQPTNRRLITITNFAESGEPKEYSGCLKDISGWGLGFVHQDELPMGQVIVTFVINDEQLSLEVDLRWSRKISRSWYESGGFFLGLRQSQKTMDDIHERHPIARIEEVAVPMEMTANFA
jgi:hypothetical protein